MSAVFHVADGSENPNSELLAGSKGSCDADRVMEASAKARRSGIGASAGVTNQRSVPRFDVGRIAGEETALHKEDPPCKKRKKRQDWEVPAGGGSLP